MTANRDLERRLAEYYAVEPPLRAPDWVLRAALATIDNTRQRRGPFAPWRFQSMSAYGKLVAAAVVVIAVGLIGWSQLAGPGGGGPPPTPTPAVTPSLTPRPTPSPTAVPSPVAGTASNFVRPFDYVLPGVPRFEYGRTDATYWEVRVPAWNDAGHPGGLILQAIGGGRFDPCDVEAAALPLDAGPDSVIAYLQTIPELTVTLQPDTTVDGRTARQATVHAVPREACPELWVWVEATEPFVDGVDLRLVIVDIDGEHIVATIYGEPDNPDWPALADELIASFRFMPR